MRRKKEKMMDRLMGVINRVPLLIRTVIASVGIICVAVVLDYFIQDYIYKNKFKIVEDDFSHVFQVDSMEVKGEKLILNGWVFKLGVDSVEDDFGIVLYDYNNDKSYYMDVENVVREDVNEYFLCEYDYSNSGFVASMSAEKLDLDEKNYEILLRPRSVQKAYRTGVYISKGEMMYTEPSNFVPVNVQGTELEKIVDDGVLRVYRPDVNTYIYQYDRKLYWIVNGQYFFEADGSTVVEFQMKTTQIDKLPAYRLENNWDWDNKGFDFEVKESRDLAFGNYRITVSDIPQEYSVTEMWTGYYGDDWVWIQHFRPWYDFSEK